MGNFFSLSGIFETLFGPRERRILLLGLDNSGKTTILYRLKLGETVATLPTIGFNLERVRYGNTIFTCFDIGGQKKIRGLWYHYYEGTDAIIYVIDVSDRKRLDDSCRELCELLRHPYLANAALLVYANKQDVKNCATSCEVEDKLRKLGVPNDFHVQSSVATQCLGIYEGLDWLNQTLRNK